jgi:lipid A 4'-phosphatase
MNRNWHKAVWLLVPLLLVAALTLWPSLDLAVSRLFYVEGAGFVHAKDPLPQFLYRIVPHLTTAGFVVLGGLLLFGLHPRLVWARQRRKAAFYLLIVLLIGPGVLVNGVLKDNWGRARPHQVQEFGGSRQFTPALVPSDQCPQNCAFVSGHAATGFALVAIGFVAVRGFALWVAGGALLGGLIGLARIAQGGHFLSDILFAFVVVYATAWLAHVILYERPWHRAPAAPS